MSHSNAQQLPATNNDLVHAPPRPRLTGHHQSPATAHHCSPQTCPIQKQSFAVTPARRQRSQNSSISPTPPSNWIALPPRWKFPPAANILYLHPLHRRHCTRWTHREAPAALGAEAPKPQSAPCGPAAFSSPPAKSPPPLPHHPHTPTPRFKHLHSGSPYQPTEVQPTLSCP